MHFCFVVKGKKIIIIVWAEMGFVWPGTKKSNCFEVLRRDVSERVRERTMLPARHPPCDWLQKGFERPSKKRQRPFQKRGAIREEARRLEGGYVGDAFRAFRLCRYAHYYEKTRSFSSKFSIFFGISHNCHHWNISFNAFSLGK